MSAPEQVQDARLLSDASCGNCGADLRGKEIPADHVAAGHYAPGVTRYSRLVGVEYLRGHPGRYDGVSEWVCPDCGYREGRWSGRALVGDDYERPLGGAA